MLVQSERDVNITKLLDGIKFKIDEYNKDPKGYMVSINISVLTDCYDVIRAFNNANTEGDDGK